MAKKSFKSYLSLLLAILFFCPSSYAQKPIKLVKMREIRVMENSYSIIFQAAEEASRGNKPLKSFIMELSIPKKGAVNPDPLGEAPYPYINLGIGLAESRIRFDQHVLDRVRDKIAELIDSGISTSSENFELGMVEVFEDLEQHLTTQLDSQQNKKISVTEKFLTAIILTGVMAIFVAGSSIAMHSTGTILLTDANPSDKINYLWGFLSSIFSVSGFSFSVWYFKNSIKNFLKGINKVYEIQRTACDASLKMNT